MRRELFSDLPPAGLKPSAVGHDLRVELQREKLRKQADILEPKKGSESVVAAAGKNQ